MKMTSWKKIAIVALLLGAAVGIAYILYGRSYPQSDANRNTDILSQKDTIIAQLLSFEIKDASLSEERKKYLTDEFDRLKKTLENASAFAQSQGSNPDAINAAFYWPLLNLGHLNRDAWDYKKAEQAYLLAYAYQPGAFIPLGDLGELYTRYYKDYDKGAEYYLKAVETESSYLETYYSELYEIYHFHLNDDARAEQILIDGVRKYPEVTNILALLAFFYRQTGQTDKAISRYNELLVKNPDSIVAKQALKELTGQE